MKAKAVVAVLSLALAGSALADMKVEDTIKFRQSAYATMGWSMARIKGNVEGTYNKDRKSTRLNSSHRLTSRMPSSA
jgi:hypothetical protein